MISKKIYLMRHGQTDYNLQGIVQGCGVDTSLNETGRNQAHAFFSKYKNNSFDRIYTSTLKRTVETVQPFIDNGFQYEPLDGLKEIHWGNKEGIQVDEKESSFYNQVLRSWREGRLTEKMKDGESPEDVALRLRNAFHYILEQKDEKEILICMHGRAMRILLCILLNYPISSMDYFPHSNTSLYQLVNTGKLTRIEKFNDLSHLNGL